MCIRERHDPAPIPEEGKWVKAKEIKDISGLTHGVGWCAPQQGACKLTLNIKEGVIQEALVETLGCSGMTHSAAMAAEILPGKTILEALNSDLVCDAINTAMRELFLQIVYGRSQSAFSEDGLVIGAAMEDLGKGLRSQIGTMYGTLKKGPRYLAVSYTHLDVYKRQALRTLDFMRDVITRFQEETGHVYNLEATPAEGTSYSLARLDKKRYPDIITAGKEEPYYTNSSQLPVGFTDDIFETLDLQDELQCKYTGGTVLHLYLGEQIRDVEVAKSLIRKAFTHYKLPYISLTPTFSICPEHGYLNGEVYTCPTCGPVSYTHLDVYKRQGWISACTRWFPQYCCSIESSCRRSAALSSHTANRIHVPPFFQSPRPKPLPMGPAWLGWEFLCSMGPARYQNIQLMRQIAIPYIL